MAVHAKVTSGIEIVQSSTLDLTNAEAKTAAELTPIDYPNGTGSGQASKAFTDTRTLGSGATENLDLAGGLTDALGNTLTFAVVKAIEIRAAAANTNNVEVGGAGTMGFSGPFKSITDIIAIPPGGRFLVAHPGAGWTVTAGSGDLLKITNSGTGSSVTYSVKIVG